MTSKYIPNIWVHGHDDWKFSEDCKVFIHQNGLNPPNSYCLGDRYIHCDSGVDSYGVIWRGSISDGWHVTSFDFDLGTAIRWVQDADYKSLGFLLWSKFSEDKNASLHWNEDRERRHET